MKTSARASHEPKSPALLADEVRWRVQQGHTAKKAQAELAKREGLSVAALKSAYHRRYPHKEGHGNNKLTPEQDRLLLWTAQSFSANNIPLDAPRVRELLKTHWGVEVGRHWVERWVARHRSSLSVRTTRALAGKRSGEQIMLNVESFCEELRLFLASHHFPDHAVLNFDETRLVHTGDKMELKRIHYNNNTRPNVLSTRNSTLASLLTFVCASGAVFMSVYILPGKFGNNDVAECPFCIRSAKYHTRSTWPSFFCWTDSGRLTDEAFASIMDTFAEQWRLCHPGLEVLLFSDQLSSHRQPEVVRGCLEKGVFLFSLPANTSHFAQPLDEAPFGAFKKRFRALSQDIIINNIISCSTTRGALLQAAFRAEELSFTPRVVRGSFRACALWPFDPVRLKKLARANVGVPEEGLESRMRSIATAVIVASQQESAKGKRDVVEGKAKVARAQVHSPEHVLALSEKKKRQARLLEEEREAKRAKKRCAREQREADQRAKQEWRKERTCQGSGCTRRCQGGRGWFECSCRRFVVCKACRQTRWHCAIFLAHKGAHCHGAQA